MKKILLYSTLALGVGLCSCSQEDLGESPAQAVEQPVTVSVQLPGEVGSDGLSRALPTVPEGCVLRCILFVSDNDESTEDIRQEVIAENAADNITFSFTPPAENYTCSFWADFLPKDGNVTGEGDEKRYTDLYYNTQNLPNVTFADNTTILFNNDACDAFTGHFDQTQITSGTPVTLSRPLAKVNFVAKEDISGNVSVTSGYTVSNGMNISKGAVSTTTATLSCTDKAVADAEGNVLFYNYLFADGESTKLPASISYTLGDKEGTIPTNEIPLAANTPYNLSFSTASGEVVASPKVGDYFFTDGTWSSSLDENKNVAGVVFAVKGDGTGSAIESDGTTNYSNVDGAADVLAWVIAAKDASTGANVKFYAGDASMSLPENMGEGKDDIKGYSNTALWVKASETDYEAASTAKAYNVEITGDTKTSGWYLPSIGQMLALGKVYAEKGENDTTTSLAVKKSFEALTAGGGDSAAAMTLGNYWTSTGGTSGTDAGAYRISFADANYGNALRTGTNAASGSYVRSVLTVFK